MPGPASAVHRLMLLDYCVGGREWEKMPDSVNVEGGKASKGEYGFRYGASVPRPMLMAFSKVMLMALSEI
jgi:hypothetical protein